MKLLTFALLTGAFMCGASVAQDRISLNPKIPSYESSPAREGVIRDEYASIQCIHKIQVSAQTDGLIEKLLADEGMTVKKGDMLLMIDQRVAKAEVAVAQKEFEAAEKQAAQTANVEYNKKASEVADSEYEDIRALYNQSAATYSEARKKQLEAERARAGIDVAEVEHKKEQLQADVTKEKLGAAKIRLSLHEVIAPYDGIVVTRLRDQGEWIRGGEPVLKLVHMNEMRVQANIELKGISVAQLQDAPMEITVTHGTQTITIPAKVEFVSPEQESSKVKVWTRIKNSAPGGVWLLRDGMTATVEITPHK